MSERLTDRQFRTYRKMWNGFTPDMKKAFRRFFKRGAGNKSAFHPNTIAAFRRRQLIMDGSETWICPTIRGCALMDYLRDTKQIVLDTPSKTEGQ